MQRCREKCHVNTEAEIAAMLAQAKECQKPSEVGRSKKGFSPRTFIEADLPKS